MRVNTGIYDEVQTESDGAFYSCAETSGRVSASTKFYVERTDIHAFVHTQ